MTDHPVTEFLTARLDEDEQAAHAATSACWHIDHCDDAGRAFHTRFTPERILAEVEAKRVLLDSFETIRQAAVPSGDEALRGLSAGLERAALDLAAVYRDHPDFWSAWLEEDPPRRADLRLAPPAIAKLPVTLDELLAETRTGIAEMPVDDQAALDQRTAELRGELTRLGLPVTRDIVHTWVAALVTLQERLKTGLEVATPAEMPVEVVEVADEIRALLTIKLWADIRTLLQAAAQLEVEVGAR